MGPGKSRALGTTHDPKLEPFRDCCGDAMTHVSRELRSESPPRRGLRHPEEAIKVSGGPTIFDE